MHIILIGLVFNIVYYDFQTKLFNILVKFNKIIKSKHLSNYIKNKLKN